MKKHGCLWWVFIGWWWVPFTLPFRIPVALIKRARAKISVDKCGQAQTTPEGEKLTQARGIEHHNLAEVENYRSAVLALAKPNADYQKTKSALQKEGRVQENIYEYTWQKFPAVLEPEPDNPDNPKALKVLVGGQLIGYIKFGSCAHIHKLLHENRIDGMSCEFGGGKYKTLIPDYDSSRERYELESDAQRLWANLTITTKLAE